MPERIPRVLATELLVSLLVLACQEPARAEKPTRPRPGAVTSTSVNVAPRAASSFAAHGGMFVQRHPRLPDSGEWRCADRAGVVWCAGGEAAAGVVAGPLDPAFRCGKRWGNAGSGERVCIDRQPDYPSGGARECRFEQTRGIERWCESASSGEPARELDARALPACWLDKDCGSGRCDRGSCRCESDADCELGRCTSGHCVEVTR
ncbi:MAG TPA: hypothetical protein VEX18_04210 [Polyangiaceae bacterium]|nr:hypothetical protein [Polyangiaceae bacterium]